MMTSEQREASKKGLGDVLRGEHPHVESTISELEEKAPDELFFLLGDRDAAAKLAEALPNSITPEGVAQPHIGRQRVWELFGFYFLALGRRHEAAALFRLLYSHLLTYQSASNQRVHKGVPLFWFAQCHSDLGNAVLAKRFFMLTLCEDAIKDSGNLNLRDSGSYLPLVWRLGIADDQVRRYVEEIWALHQKHEIESRFPEWILQQLDHEWMAELPNANEIGLYIACCPYIQWLLDRTADGDGKNLELLAQYLISLMPGCRAVRRVKSEVSDYDVVGVFEGSFIDFRSEFGRYFLVECKDWARPADFTTVAKFCRVLDSSKCRFGILFSREGVSGQEQTQFAWREIVKVFQDRGIVIVVVNYSDLDAVANGKNFLTMLRSKY